MRLVIVSLLFGLLIGALVVLPFGWPIAYGIIPGLLAAFGAAYFIYRRVSERLAGEMLVVQNILAAAPQRPATSVAEQREMEAKARTTIDQAVVVLLSVRDRLGPWIPTMSGQISGNIGSLFYMSKRFDDARPYLAAAAFNHGLAHAMLGAIHFRDKAPLLMKAAFERAVKWSEKEALIWNCYAWCLDESGARNEAIAVLNRGIKAMTAEPRTQANLENLQNGRKLKMQPFDMPWYQLLLEEPPREMVEQMMGGRDPRAGLPRPGFRATPKAQGGKSLPQPTIRRRDTRG